MAEVNQTIDAPEPGERWMHREKPIRVTVLHVGMWEPTTELVVIYQHEGDVWVRLLPVFVERFRRLAVPAGEPARLAEDRVTLNDVVERVSAAVCELIQKRDYNEARLIRSLHELVAHLRSAPPVQNELDRICRIADENSALKARIAELEKLLEVANLRIAELEAERDAISSDYGTLLNESNDYERTVKTAQQRIAELQAEVERLKAAQRWIPCAERLPVVGLPVVVRTPREIEKVRTARLLVTGVWRSKPHDFADWEVSDWMPLPEPPQPEPTGDAA